MSKLLRRRAQVWAWMTLPPAHFVTAPCQPALAGTASSGARRLDAEKAPDMVADPGRPPSHAQLDAPRPAPGPEARRERRRRRGQVALLCWTHSVIGFGFFGAPWQLGLLTPWAAAAVQLLHVSGYQRRSTLSEGSVCLPLVPACPLTALLSITWQQSNSSATLLPCRAPALMYTWHWGSTQQCSPLVAVTPLCSPTNSHTLLISNVPASYALAAQRCSSGRRRCSRPAACLTCGCLEQPARCRGRWAPARPVHCASATSRVWHCNPHQQIPEP